MNFLGANAAFGLLAAALWGGGDFSGSIAVKRSGGTVRAALAVVCIGHLLSLAFVASLATLHHETLPHGAALAWGIGGGALSAIALVGFYIALASGHMGSAAAVSGLLCAAVPAAVSAFTEGMPGYARIAGFLLAGGAIWLIASASDPHVTADRRAMLISIASGIGFGIYFVSLKMAAAHADGVLWPMGSARIGSFSISAIALLFLFLQDRTPSGAGSSLQKRTLLIILLGAALDTCGNLSFLAGTRAGRLDVAAVLASLYPASTILLAAALLHEKTTKRQRIGMLLALPAVVLITL